MQPLLMCCTVHFNFSLIVVIMQSTYSIYCYFPSVNLFVECITQRKQSVNVMGKKVTSKTTFSVIRHIFMLFSWQNSTLNLFEPILTSYVYCIDNINRRCYYSTYCRIAEELNSTLWSMMISGALTIQIPSIQIFTKKLVAIKLFYQRMIVS